MKTTYLSTILLSGAILLQSCGSEEVAEVKTTPKAPQKEIVETPVVEEETIEEKFEFIPPSTIQIASIFKKAGIEYSADALNPVENVDLYLSQFSQSLNFGVYSSDLANCVLNDQAVKGKIYLKTLKELSAKIGLETVMADEDLLTRFDANIGNQDSIISILFYVHENTDEYITANGKDDLAVVYYTGAWIEGMYFGALKAKTATDKSELGMLISEQMTIAESIYQGLLHLDKKDVDSDDLATSIKDIMDMYNGFESVKMLGEDVAFLDVLLTDEEIEKISNELIELRTSIVE